MALGILLGMYSCMVFLIPFPKNTIFAVSYVFAIVAVAIQILVWKVAWLDSETVQSKFYGVPILRVGIIYLFGQFILSTIFMIVSEWIPSWVPVLIYILALGVMLLGCIAADVAKEQVDKIDEQIKKQTFVIKRMRVEAEYLHTTFSTTSMAETLRKVREALRYSDPVSSEKLNQKEDELQLLLQKLRAELQEEKTENAEKTAQEFLAVLEERNNLCKLCK